MLTAENFIYDKIENTKKDFDSKNQKLLSDVESEIYTACVTKLIGFLKGANYISENRIYFFSLLSKAEDMIVSSLHLARQRASIETFSILRIAIEAIATAIHVSKEKKALYNYLKGSYKYTDSISYSKKHIPIIGEIWGAFSQAVVHINCRTYGPKIKIDKNKLYKSVTVNYEINPSDNALDYLLLIAIQLIAVMAHRAFEIIFFKKILYDGKLWFSIPGTKLILMPITRYSDKIGELYNKFLDIGSFNRGEN